MYTHTVHTRTRHLSPHTLWPCKQIIIALWRKIRIWCAGNGAWRIAPIKKEEEETPLSLPARVLPIFFYDDAQKRRHFGYIGEEESKCADGSSRKA